MPTPLENILASKPAIDIGALSPDQSAVLIGRLIRIAQPFFVMNPNEILRKDNFRPLSELLAGPFRGPRNRNYLQYICDNLQFNDMCLLLERTPGEQEVYRMASGQCYTEANLLVRQDGMLLFWESKIVCEHDSIIDTTFYHVESDRLEYLGSNATKYYEATHLNPLAAVRKIINFMQSCRREVQPIVEANIQIKEIGAQLGICN